MSRRVRVERPVWRANTCAVVCHRADANELLTRDGLPKFDVVYHDPPYNRRDYSTMYSLLNVVARNEKPAEWSPVTHLPRLPKKRDRSAYNMEAACERAMAALVEASLAVSTYVLVSYNEEGLIDNQGWERILQPYEARKLTKEHKRYKCRGRSAPVKVTEFLYVINRKPLPPSTSLDSTASP